MSELGWNEISAHRVLVIAEDAGHQDFEIIHESEDPVKWNGEVLYRRRSDGKLFRFSPWQPANRFAMCAVALVEV